MNDRSCADCKWAHYSNGVTECRRFPPAYRGSFPRVGSKLFCGEWAEVPTVTPPEPAPVFDEPVPMPEPEPEAFFGRRSRRGKR